MNRTFGPLSARFLVLLVLFLSLDPAAVTRAADEPIVSVYPKDQRTTPIRVWRPLPPVDGSGFLRNSVFELFTGGTIRLSSNIDQRSSVEGSLPVQDESNRFRFEPRDARWIAVHAYYHLNRAYEYFRLHGLSSWEDYRLPVHVQVRLPGGRRYVNSFSGNVFRRESTRHNFLAFGELPDGKNFALDTEVIDHEFGHYLQDRLNPGYFRPALLEPFPESRAVAEALAEYTAMTLQDDPCLGQYVAYHLLQRECFRTATNPRRYPEDVGESARTDGRGPYTGWADFRTQPEVLLGALWDLRRLLGPEIMDRLFIDMMPRLEGAGHFRDVLRAFLAADAALYQGRYAPEIIRAFDHRGITEELPPYLTPDALNQEATLLKVTLGVVSGGAVSPRLQAATFVAGRSYTLSGGVEDRAAETAVLALLDMISQPIPNMESRQTIRSRSVQITTSGGKTVTGRSFSFPLKFTPEQVGLVKSLSLTLEKPGESRTAVVPISVTPERGPLEPLSPDDVAPPIRPLGDVNGDAKLTMEDVVLGLRRIVGLEPWGDEISLDLGRTWPNGTTGDDEQAIGDLISLLRRVGGT